MNSAVAVFLLVVFLLLFLIFVVSLIVLNAIAFFIIMPIGAIAGPIIACCYFKKIVPLLICFICIAPFTMIAGAFVIPVLGMIELILPYERRLIVQFCNTLGFLRACIYP